jgi:hypothetical protein
MGRLFPNLRYHFVRLCAGTLAVHANPQNSSTPNRYVNSGVPKDEGHSPLNCPLVPKKEQIFCLPGTYTDLTN